jgi:hypothetical protein
MHSFTLRRGTIYRRKLVHHMPSWNLWNRRNVMHQLPREYVLGPGKYLFGPP